LKQGASEIVEKYELESNTNLLVYAAGRSTGIKYDKKNEGMDRSGGRTVFYVTVGQMKHTKIILKPISKEKETVISAYFWQA
jgi:hypothetical protein